MRRVFDGHIGVSTSSFLFKAQEKLKKLAEMRNQLKEQIVEMDETCKSPGKGWINLQVYCKFAQPLLSLVQATSKSTI